MTKPVDTNEDKRCDQQKKDYVINKMSYTNIMINTIQKPRPETWNKQKRHWEKHHKKTTIVKLQTETQGKRNNKNTGKPETQDRQYHVLPNNHHS